MTGSEGSIILFRNADSQSLVLGQRLKNSTRVQRADVAVMRRCCSDKVIQQEVTREGDAWEHHQRKEQNLVTSKAIGLIQNVLELHPELKN